MYSTCQGSWVEPLAGFEGAATLVDDGGEAPIDFFFFITVLTAI